MKFDDAPRPEGCDYEGDHRLISIKFQADGTTRCRCLLCGRCGRHTGNSTQGHAWSYCKVTKQVEAPHYCCPGDCELVVPA